HGGSERGEARQRLLRHLTGQRRPPPQGRGRASESEEARRQETRQGASAMTSDIADRVRGVLFGQAVGDALGFGTEFMPKSAVSRHYPDGLSDYAQIGGRFEPCEQWRPGDWTDDTDQLLCILDS